MVAAGEAPECAAGRLALASMPGPEPDRTILEQLPGAQPSVRIELIRALAARGIRAGAALLPDQLSQSNDAVRQAALEALAVLGDRRAALCNDLTKLFEKVERGPISSLIPSLRDAQGKDKALKGEWVVVIEGSSARVAVTDDD